jgi:electron transport complex protein RnfC
LTVSGDGFGKNGVVTLPYGTPWRTVLETMQFKSGAYETKVNSLLNGKKAVGAMSEKAEAVFASMPVQREEQHCISCGKCAQVCPMRLQPFLALKEKSYLSAKHLASVCIGCGCCEYICPSALRLPERIRRYQT